MAFKKMTEYNAEKYNNRFVLKNDGDSADVIFLYRGKDDVLEADAHYINSADYTGYVHCNGKGCPACAKGIRVQKRLFIPLYVINSNQEEVNEIQYFDRTVRFDTQLQRDVFQNYPNPSQYVFKITRKGAANDINTSYEIRAIAESPISYDEILAKFNTSMPEHYENIIKEFESTEMFAMLDTKGDATNNAPTLPSYKITPRGGFGSNSFDAVPRQSTISDDAVVGEPNFDGLDEDEEAPF